MSELKPCPFCGKDVFLLDVATRSSANALWDIYCRTHGCFLNSGTNNMFSNREDAILAWNTRAESLELATLREQVKVLREALEDGRDDLGMWLSVALEDPKTCISFKTCIQVWMDVTFEALEQTKPKDGE